MPLFGQLVSPRLPAAFTFELQDRTPILVRPLRPDDADRLSAGFARLSLLSRRRRFFADTLEPGAEQLRALTLADQRRDAAWGIIDLNRPDEPGVGIARYNTVNGDPASADVAVAVVEPYQGRGAGLLLHACLHLAAHRAGIQRFYHDVASDDARFIAALKSLGARFEGRASNIDRLSMPVYHRAWGVPARTRNGQRLRQLMQQLHHVQAPATATAA